MQAFTQELTLAGSGRPDPADLLAALPPSLSWSPAGRRRTVRRTWLDTFDWRLYRAGLTLELRTSSAGSELSLAAADGSRIAAPGGDRTRWPALAGRLPAGELRARLAPVTGVRALAPVARGVSRQRDIRVLNADAKTVAWLAVDEISVAGPDAADLPARLTVTAVRGYQAETERAVAALAHAAGTRPGAVPVLEAVLAPGGERPGCYSNKVDVAMTEGMPARLAMAAVLQQLLDTLEANIDGTIGDIDTEFLHDLRVSVRRTRSALKLAGGVLPEGLAARFRPGFKWLGDLTTPTRDLDVYLLGYDAMAAGLVAATPAELQPFRTYLRRRRYAARRRLVRGLRSEQFTGLLADWRAAISELATPDRGPAAAEFAAARITRAHKRVMRLGGAITADSPPDSLHDLRKRCKELRYLLEFFAPLHDPAVHGRALKQLKGLQDCLGEFQDGQVQQQEIRDIAAAMRDRPATPVTALLAMGEVAAQAAAGQHEARHEFAGRFADFAAAGTRHRFGALTAAAAT